MCCLLVKEIPSRGPFHVEMEKEMEIEVEMDGMGINIQGILSMGTV